MSILQELYSLISVCDIPVETGVFSGVPPDVYVVITPLSDIFEAFADNRPQFEIQEARLSLFSKENYTEKKRKITVELLMENFTITDRRFIERDDESGYFQYCIDLSKSYEMEG